MDGKKQCLATWWFQTFFMFTPTWGNDPIRLIFFKWVKPPTSSWWTVRRSLDDHFPDPKWRGNDSNKVGENGSHQPVIHFFREIKLKQCKWKVIFRDFLGSKYFLGMIMGPRKPTLPILPIAEAPFLRKCFAKQPRSAFVAWESHHELIDFAHSIHGTNGIFPYMQTLKINHSCREIYQSHGSYMGWDIVERNFLISAKAGPQVSSYK